MNNPTNPAVPEPLAPPAGRNRQRWFLLVVAAMVAVAGGILLRGHLARRRAAEGDARLEARLLEEQAGIEARLHEAMAEAERLDGPWRFADIQARLAKVPEDEDSATILRAVAQKMPPIRPSGSEVPLFNRWVGLVPTVPLDAALTERLRQERDAAGEALALARTLADRPRGRIAVDWTALAPWAAQLTPERGPAATLLTLDAIVRIHEGDLEGALRSCRAILYAACAVGDTPTFGAQGVRIEQRNLILFPLEHLLAQGEPPAAALADLQERLAEETRQPLMLLAARGERAIVDRLCQAAQDGEITLGRAAGIESADREQKTFQAQGSGGMRAAWRRRILETRATLLEKMNRRVEILKLPPEKLDQLRELEKPQPKESIFVQHLFQDHFGSVQGWRSSQARLLTAMTALAAERYRQKHGRWPERLAALVPDYLSAVPTDPFDGAPLRYGKAEGGVVIYSVSILGKDRGWASSDMSFRLWDRRRWVPRAER